MSEPHVIAINSGSSSIKFALFQYREALQRVWSGAIERIGMAAPRMEVKGTTPDDDESRVIAVRNHSAAVAILMDWIEERCRRLPLTAIGHRIVQGGPEYIRPQTITPEMIEALRKLRPYDPEHLPGELLLIEAFQGRFPELPQVACFDTDFFRELPRVAQLLPLPRKYENTFGVRRYGFHGLSYRFLMEELSRGGAEMQPHRRVILAHLGHGASVAAVRDGRPIDTTMSFTPSSGVPMGTRAGDLDSGLFWFLANQEKMTPEEFNAMVNFQSGLLGVSETSSDMRELLDREPGDSRAAEAVALFCYEIKKRIGALAAALDGVDTLVFAGGIGEHSPVVRDRICAGLSFLGIDLDPDRNAENQRVISRDCGRVDVRVLATDEQRMIGETVCRILGLGKWKAAGAAGLV